MLYSYVVARFEDGHHTGVPRFDHSLRQVFPGLQSVTKLPELKLGDVVITDNHLSLQVPPEIRTVVVHHGCARTHFDRDPDWRTVNTREIVKKQEAMFSLPNRIWVAPSSWVAEQFMAVIRGQFRKWNVIPHWVEPIPRLMRHQRPVIIGDWRDNNKGAAIWRGLAERHAQWEFQPLNFRDEAGKRKQYGEASLYLCLSLSEGGSYSMCDAEAAELPIVTTDVGNCREFSDCEVIRWQDRDNDELVAAAIDRKLHQDRKQPSFYQQYTFGKWAERWREVVQ